MVSTDDHHGAAAATSSLASSSSSFSTTISAPIRKPPLHCYYAVDVLTDGSEKSFAGGIPGAGAALFLSVHKLGRRTAVVAGAAAKEEQQQEHDANANVDDDNDYDESGVVLARYAISGIGDLTSRLASDQRLKLGSVRAVFAPGNSVTSTDRRSADATTISRSPSLPATAPLWGLPSLFMALQKAGAETLTVVTAGGGTSGPEKEETDSGTSRPQRQSCYVEQVMQLLHSRSTHPTVRTCQVPIESSSSSASPSWWNVYHDEFVAVHATTSRVATGDASGDDDPTSCAVPVVYLYTLRRMRVANSTLPTQGIDGNSRKAEPEPMSLLVVPPGCFGYDVAIVPHNDSSSWLESILDPSTLPVSIHSIQLGVAVEPRSMSSFQHDIQSLPLRFPWVYTKGSSEHELSSEKGVAEHDPSLLVRATRQAKLRHDQDPSHFPWSHASIGSTSAVTGPPTNCGTSPTSSEVEDRRRDGEMAPSEPDDNNCGGTATWTCRPTRLRTGRSLVLIPTVNEEEEGTSGVEMNVVDRTRSLLIETYKESSVGGDEDDDRDGPSSLEDYSLLDGDNAPRSGSCTDAAADDNQIDLDNCLEDDLNSDESDDAACDDQTKTSLEEPFKVELLCLGTGCAAPSPYRGASGYAVFVNPSTSVVLDAGEGFVTQWNRHAQHRHCLSTIRIICISHAHWDHFGGLVPLLAAIHEAQRHEGTVNDGERCRDSRTSLKRPRVAMGGTSALHESNSRAPLLLAPDRVLQYVALSLDNAHGTYCTPISLQRRDFAALLHRHLSELSREAVGGVNTAPAGCLEASRGQLLKNGSASSPSVPTLLTLDKVLVDHCPHSYGFILAFHRPTPCFAPPPSVGTASPAPIGQFLFCYSGDTRPCDNLVRACHFHSGLHHGRGDGRGSIDFLLHEATFVDADASQCEMKRHSTVGDAVEISRRVRARRTLLTHFSQRYGDHRSRHGSCSRLLAIPGGQQQVGRDLCGVDDEYKVGNVATPSSSGGNVVMGAVDGLQVRLC